MDSLSNGDLLKNITRQDLIEYLELSGWKNVESPKAVWVVYAGPDDYYGEPLEIVLSKRDNTDTANQYLASAVDLLSTLRQESPSITTQRIQNVNRDVLNLRNTDDNITISIPLTLAARQVKKLQTLVRQASNSERDVLPYYRSNYYNSQADRMVNSFQFGHTQNRSFGLVVQSPVLPDPILYVQTRFDIPEEVEPPLMPIERRITERVVRGLVAAKNAVKQHSIASLVESYNSGFSSNMCSAIVDISDNKRATIEYSVLWSPKIPPPNDIAEVHSILLNETDYAYLEHAANEMKVLKQPEDTFLVRGLVSLFSATDNPSKLDTGRSVIVNWKKPDIDRYVKIIVELNPEDYLSAVDAHKYWYPIEVTGEARMIGNRWRLLNPRNFRAFPGDIPYEIKQESF